MRKFYFKCESHEEYTREVTAENLDEAVELFDKGKSAYVPGTNTVGTERVLTVFVIEDGKVKILKRPQ